MKQLIIFLVILSSYAHANQCNDRLTNLLKVEKSPVLKLWNKLLSNNLEKNFDETLYNLEFQEYLKRFENNQQVLNEIPEGIEAKLALINAMNSNLNLKKLNSSKEVLKLIKTVKFEKLNSHKKYARLAQDLVALNYGVTPNWKSQLTTNAKKELDRYMKIIISNNVSIYGLKKLMIEKGIHQSNGAIKTVLKDHRTKFVFQIFLNSLSIYQTGIPVIVSKFNREITDEIINLAINESPQAAAKYMIDNKLVSRSSLKYDLFVPVINTALTAAIMLYYKDDILDYYYSKLEQIEASNYAHDPELLKKFYKLKEHEAKMKYKEWKLSLTRDQFQYHLLSNSEEIKHPYYRLWLRVQICMYLYDEDQINNEKTPTTFCPQRLWY